jgi:hypothetical protein
MNFCFTQQGFYELVPPALISVFSPAELELLVCGLPDVSVVDLQGNTEYHQYKAGDEVIGWFWEILHGLGRQQRASFLQFVTGTSKVRSEIFLNFLFEALQDCGSMYSPSICYHLSAFAERA